MFYSNLGHGWRSLTFAFPNLANLELDIYHICHTIYHNVIHQYRLLELGWEKLESDHINYGYYVIAEVNMLSHNGNNQNSISVLPPEDGGSINYLFSKIFLLYIVLL